MKYYIPVLMLQSMRFTFIHSDGSTHHVGAILRRLDNAAKPGTWICLAAIADLTELPGLRGSRRVISEGSTLIVQWKETVNDPTLMSSSSSPKPMGNVSIGET